MYPPGGLRLPKRLLQNSFPLHTFSFCLTLLTIFLLRCYIRFILTIINEVCLTFLTVDRQTSTKLPRSLIRSEHLATKKVGSLGFHGVNPHIAIRSGDFSWVLQHIFRLKPSLWEVDFGRLLREHRSGGVEPLALKRPETAFYKCCNWGI